MEDHGQALWFLKKIIINNNIFLGKPNYKISCFSIAALFIFHSDKGLETWSVMLNVKGNLHADCLIGFRINDSAQYSELL